MHLTSFLLSAGTFKLQGNQHTGILTVLVNINVYCFAIPTTSVGKSYLQKLKKCQQPEHQVVSISGDLGPKQLTYRTEVKLEGFVWNHWGITLPLSHPK